MLTEGVRKLVLYEPPMGFLKSPPHVVERLQTLLEEGRRDELLGYFMQEVGGLPSDQVDLMRSLPAWEARLDAADTIPREERASRNTSSMRVASATSRCQRYISKAATERALQGRRRGATGGSAGLPRRDHARAATRRDGHRHRPVHRRGAELPGGAGAGGLSSVTPAQARRRASATALALACAWFRHWRRCAVGPVESAASPWMREPAPGRGRLSLLVHCGSDVHSCDAAPSASKEQRGERQQNYSGALRGVVPG